MRPSRIYGILRNGRKKVTDTILVSSVYPENIYTESKISIFSDCTHRSLVYGVGFKVVAQVKLIHAIKIRERKGERDIDPLKYFAITK